MSIKIERVAVALIAAVVPAMVAMHGLGTVLRAMAAADVQAPALWTAGIVALVALVQGLLLVSAARPRAALSLGASALAAAAVGFWLGSWIDATAVMFCSWLQGIGMRRIALKLPPDVDGVFARRPVKAAGWTLLALLAVVQTGRLSAYAAEIETDWFLTTNDAWWADHMCQSAYFYAADLQRRGETNVYDSAHYPALNRDAQPTTGISNLQSHIDDPFQYPPQFLLLPLGALALSNDFYVIRSVWFALQVLTFLAATVWLARWVGAARGRMALWALPAVLASVPILQNFQFGQFHLMACLLALVGMVLFERGRTVSGAALLSLAIVSKIFPGLLVLVLIARKQWREVAACAAWCVAFSVLAWALLGSAPFEAFFRYHLPRLESGEAFAFEQAWPEIGDDALMINLSISRVPEKIAKLGLAGIQDFGGWASRGYGVLLLLLALVTARRHGSRAGRLACWFALLNLFVLQGGGGFSDYVAGPDLLLLGFLAIELGRGRLRGLLLGLCWVFFFLSLGTQPMPDRVQAPLGLIAGLVLTGMIIALNVWVALRADPDSSPDPSGTGGALTRPRLQ